MDGHARNVRRSPGFEGDARHHLDCGLGEWTDRRLEGRWQQWAPDHVGVQRVTRTRLYPIDPGVVGGVTFWRQGSAAVYRGFRYDSPEREHDSLDPLRFDALRTGFTTWIEVLRSIALDFGAHGTIRLAYRLEPRGRRLILGNTTHELGGAMFERWMRSDEDVDHVANRVFAELARSVGVGPAE